MTFVFDARASEPALPANDMDAAPVPVLRLLETPASPRRKRLAHRLLRKAR